MRIESQPHAEHLAIVLAQARRRVEQLRAAGSECVTMCPLCLVNLSKAADGTIAFKDISEVLLEARAAAPEPARV